MDFIARLASPLGPVLLASDGAALTGLWFEGQKYYARGLAAGSVEADLPVFDAVRAWLDTYFSGEDPGPAVPVAPTGTAFQKAVWQRLRAIPYGQTVTYGRLARDLGCSSARAVGGAVGKNPVSILIPCHRVVGTSGKLTGYAGGVDKKAALLRLEGILKQEKAPLP